MGGAILLITVVVTLFLAINGGRKLSPPLYFTDSKGKIAKFQIPTYSSSFLRVRGSTVGSSVLILESNRWVEAPGLRVSCGWDYLQGFTATVRVTNAPWKVQLRASLTRELPFYPIRFATSNLWESGEMPALPYVERLP